MLSVGEYSRLNQDFAPQYELVLVNKMCGQDVGL